MRRQNRSAPGGGSPDARSQDSAGGDPGQVKESLNLSAKDYTSFLAIATGPSQAYQDERKRLPYGMWSCRDGRQAATLASPPSRRTPTSGFAASTIAKRSTCLTMAARPGCGGDFSGQGSGATWPS